MAFVAQVSGTLVRLLAVPLLGLAAMVLVARVLGPEGNGLYALAVMLPTLAVAFLNLGLPTANVYHLGRKSVSVGGLVRSTGGWWLVLSFAGSAGLAALAAGPAAVLAPGLPTKMVLLGAGMFSLLFLGAIAASLLNGVGDFGALNRGLVVGPGVVVVALAALAARGVLSVENVLYVTLVGQGASLLALSWPLRRHWGRSRDGAKPDPSLRRRVLGYGLRSHLGDVLQSLNVRVDLLLLNAFVGVGAVGLYVIPLQLSERLSMLARAVSTVLLPRLAGDYVDQDDATATTTAARVTFGLTLIASLGLALSGYPLIDLLFGSRFHSSYAALLCLLPGAAFGALLRILSNDFAARGMPEANVSISARMVVLNLGLSLLLIPRLGGVGAALATTLAYTYAAVSHLRRYCVMTSLRPLAVLFDPRADLKLVKALVRGKP